MAAMTTVLTEFANLGNSRTSTYGTHSAVQPKLIIEKRRVPENGQIMAEYTAKVVEATTDADSAVMSQKVSFEAVCRYPITGNSAEITSALVIFRDLIAGDEYANSVTTQEYL